MPIVKLPSSLGRLLSRYWSNIVAMAESVDEQVKLLVQEIENLKTQLFDLKKQQNTVDLSWVKDEEKTDKTLPEEEKKKEDTTEAIVSEVDKNKETVPPSVTWLDKPLGLPSPPSPGAKVSADVGEVSKLVPGSESTAKSSTEAEAKRPSTDDTPDGEAEVPGMPSSSIDLPKDTNYIMCDCFIDASYVYP